MPKNNLTVDGKIRTNRTCPFLSRCSMRTKECPQRGHKLNSQFSCGTARLFARAQPVILDVVEPTIEMDVFDIARAVELKKSERYNPTTWIDPTMLARDYAK